MGEIIPVELLEKYDGFVHDLEELFNRHKVYLSANQEGTVQIKPITARNFASCHPIPNRLQRVHVPSHIYYDLDIEWEE